jgi:hypothetical protein
VDKARDQALRLKKLFKKFLKVYKDDINDFLEIFDGLNEGAEIGLGDMENKEVANLLEKIFKALGLSVNASNEYFLDKELVVNNPKSVVNSHIQRILAKAAKGKADNGNSSSDEGSDSGADAVSLDGGDMPLEVAEPSGEKNKNKKSRGKGELSEADKNKKVQALIEKHNQRAGVNLPSAPDVAPSQPKPKQVSYGPTIPGRDEIMAKVATGIGADTLPGPKVSETLIEGEQAFAD